MCKYYHDVSDYLSLDKLDIREDLTKIKIDVGLAGEAPNSAIWLSENDDRFVIGIEPLSHHWNMLSFFETSNTTRVYPDDFKIIQLHDQSVKFNRNTVCSIKDRFLGIKCAIDNVEGLEKVDFFEMDRHLGASGSSSLLRPSEHHPHFLNDVVKTKVISLKMLLEKIDFNRFKFIEHLKTDCEGKDFDVVKSCKEYLEKIVFITSEMTNNTHHVIGACDPNEFVSFMVSNGFRVISHYGGNINFVNDRFLAEISNLKLNNNTLGA